HPDRRPERLETPRGAPSRRQRLLADRPRLDQRRRGARQACQAAEAGGRDTLHARVDRDRLLPGVGVVLASAQVETTLLLLKIAFLVLLYLFIWRIVRSAARDLRLPQESMILRPHQVAGLLPQPTSAELGRLVVAASPALEEREVFPLDSSPRSIGR